MFVSGFNINLQVLLAYSCSCIESCVIELSTTHLKSIQDRFISRNLIKSQMRVGNVMECGLRSLIHYVLKYTYLLN